MGTYHYYHYSADMSFLCIIRINIGINIRFRSEKYHHGSGRYITISDSVTKIPIFGFPAEHGEYIFLLIIIIQNVKISFSGQNTENSHFRIQNTRFRQRKKLYNISTRVPKITESIHGSRPEKYQTPNMMSCIVISTKHIQNLFSELSRIK